MHGIESEILVSEIDNRHGHLPYTTSEVLASLAQYKRVPLVGVWRLPNGRYRLGCMNQWYYRLAVAAGHERIKVRIHDELS